MTTGYNRAQILLHWAIGLLIVVNYFVSEGMGEALDASLEGKAVSGGWHVWIGMTILALVLVRVIVKFAAGAPEAGGEPGSLTQRLAGWSHLLMYVLMVAVPLGGAIVWFFGVDALGEGHQIAANVLMILAGLHALAALYHQYFVKDGLLLRMMRARS